MVVVVGSGGGGVVGGGDGCVGSCRISSTCSSLARALARPRVECTSRSSAMKRSRLARSVAFCLSTSLCICPDSNSCDASTPSNRNLMSRRAEDMMGGGGDGGGATASTAARDPTGAAGLPDDGGGRPCTSGATARAMADCPAWSVQVSGD